MLLNTNSMPRYNTSLEEFKNIRQGYKKKRVILDENESNFGFKNLELLSDVKNETEVKGYPYKATTKDDKMYGIKVIPITKEYPKSENPTYLEGMLLKEFTEEIVNKKISPHIVYYITSKKIPNSSKAIRHINLKKMEDDGLIERKSVVLMSEFVNGGNLSDWVYNIYEEHKSKGGDDENVISNTQWKAIVFGVLYTVHVLQHKYNFMHNDFHYGNVLMDTSVRAGGYYIYKIKNEGIWYIPNTGVIPKIWDMEFGMSFSNKINGIYPNRFVIGDARYNSKRHLTVEEDIENIEGNDVINVPVNYNKVYDVHYFLTGLLDLYISQELFNWIVELYPSELIPEDQVNESEESSIYTEEESESYDETSTDNSTNAYTSGTSGTNTSDVVFLHDARMINGVEKIFNNLPDALTLLKSDFFKEFKERPSDLDMSKCEVFEL